jgi:hypothetical protein
MNIEFSDAVFSIFKTEEGKIALYTCNEGVYARDDQVEFSPELADMVCGEIKRLANELKMEKENG